MKQVEILELSNYCCRCLSGLLPNRPCPHLIGRLAVPTSTLSNKQTIFFCKKHQIFGSVQQLAREHSKKKEKYGCNPTHNSISEFDDSIEKKVSDEAAITTEFD